LQDLRLHLIAPLASAILQLLGLAAQQNRSAAAAWHAAAQPTAAQLQLLDNGYCARRLRLQQLAAAAGLLLQLGSQHY